MFGLGSSSTEGLRKIAGAISKQYKVTVDFHYGGESSHSEVSKRKISINLADAHKYGEDYAVGLLLHEVAHIRFSEASLPASVRALPKKKAAAGIYNWLEDRRIDGLMQKEYAGAKGFQDALHVPTLTGIQTTLERIPSKDDAEQSYVWKRAVALASLEVEGYRTSFCETGNPEVTGLARKELARLYGGITAKSSVQEVAEVVGKVYELLDLWLPPEGGGEGGEGERGESDKQQEGQGGEGAVGCGGTLFQNKGHKHGAAGGHETGGLGSVADSGALDGTPLWTLQDRESLPLVDKLKKKLVAKLRDTEHEQWAGGQRRGRLNKKALSRVAYQDNPRIYRKRIEKKGKRYSFAVVLDCSGSMWNGYSAGVSDARIKNGMTAAAALIRTIRALGFKAGLVAYGWAAKTVLPHNDIYIPETVDQRLRNSPNYGGKGSHYYSGGNETKNAIKEALSWLKKLPHEKVMVIITDGGLERHDVQKSRLLIEEAKKKGIQTIIYYVESGLSRLTGDDREVEIKNASQLVPATEKLLKSLAL